MINYALDGYYDNCRAAPWAIERSNYGHPPTALLGLGTLIFRLLTPIRLSRLVWSVGVEVSCDFSDAGICRFRGLETKLSSPPSCPECLRFLGRLDISVSPCRVSMY